MADTYTTNLNLTKPEPGAAEDTWGISLNADLDSLDAIFGSGGTAVSMGAVTLDGLTVDGVGSLDNNGLNLELSSSNTGIIYDAQNGYHTFKRNGTNALQINGGNGDIAFYDDTGTSQNLKWDASADSLNFVDLAAAHFGTGSDLEIYHDGTNSYLKNNNGDLYIRQNTNDKDVVIQSDNGSGGLSAYFRADGSTGETILYHYGSQKISTSSSGINVTGDAVATDEFRGEVVSYANNQDAPYLIAGTSGYTGATTNWNTYGFQHRFKTTATGAPRVTIDTYLGEAFAVTNNNRVGIGTGEPTTLLHLSSTDPRITLTDTSLSGDCNHQIRGADQFLELSADTGNTQAGSVIKFSVDGSEAARFDSSGNLLISQSAQISPGFGNTQLGSSLRENGSAAFSRVGNSTQPTLMINKILMTE